MRSIDDYIHTRIQLGRSAAYTADVNFHSAIIFFTPKIVDKGIDPNGLSCEMVQVIDRGDWGKEDVESNIEASSLSNRKFREFYLKAECESYTLKFIPPLGLKLGLIDIYFDQDFDNMPSSNPSSVNSADITAGVAAALAQNNEQAAAANAAANNRAVRTRPKSLTALAKPWTGDIQNHLLLAENADRLQVDLMHTGRNATTISNSRVKLVIGDTTDKNDNAYDDFVERDGHWHSAEENDTSAIYGWVEANKAPVIVSFSLRLPL
jgi:hypothetical protein